MKPPIEDVKDEVEFAKRLNECINKASYFAEQFLGFDVYDYNKVYLDCKDRFIVYRTGRQIGKTMNTAIKAIHFGYFAPFLSKMVENEATILLTSQSEDQARIMFTKIKESVMRSKILIEAKKNETKTELWLNFCDGSGTAHFIVRPVGDAGDSVRGYSPHLIIIDESAYVPEKVYSALLPAGLASKAKVFLTSTPADRAGTFYEATEASHTLYEKGKPKKLKEKNDTNIWTQFHVRSWDNPNAKDDPVFMNMVKNMSKQKQRAELDGEFLEAGSSLLSHELIQDAFAKVDMPEIAHYDLGVDTSGKGEDETVVMEIAITKTGVCFPVGIYTEDTTDQTKLAATIASKHRLRNYRRIYVDSTGLGEGLVDALKHTKVYLPVTPINFKAEKVEMYNGLVVAFENRGINLSHVPEGHHEKFRRQLQYLYADYGLHGDGAVKIRTFDDHDDYADALALGCYSQYGVGEWHEMPADIMGDDLDPMVKEKENEEPAYYLGSLRLS